MSFTVTVVILQFCMAINVCIVSCYVCYILVRLSCMSSSSSSFDVLLGCILPLLLVFFVSIFIFNSWIIKVVILIN